VQVFWLAASRRVLEYMIVFVFITLYAKNGLPLFLDSCKQFLPLMLIGKSNGELARLQNLQRVGPFAVICIIRFDSQEGQH
jgi:hypothetical protein